MDTARAAVRTNGVEKVFLVYRRTKRYMPAAEDELLEVLEDGVEFRELLSPVSLENGKLLCEKVFLVYRRTKRYMPAAEDELLEVLEDGVEFRELLSPVSLENGKLLCKVMELGKADASGRASVTETGKTEEVPADTVIVAVGEKTDAEIYQANGIEINERGKAKYNQKTMETGVSGRKDRRRNLSGKRY